MDLHLTDEQEQLVATVASMLGAHASTEAVRAAEPSGFDPKLWTRFVELGVVAMAVGEDAGGFGASMLDLALVAEQVGRAVAPVPLVEAQVAARLLDRLDRLDGGGIVGEVLDDVVEGRRLVTVALHDARGGRTAAVPAGAVADAVIVLREGALVLVDLDERRRAFDNLGSLPLADVPVHD